MTARQHRLHRLCELREMQHDVSVGHLRGAQAELCSAEIAVQQAEEEVRAARNMARAATIGGDANDWLLASAEGELCAFNVQKRQAIRARASLAVDAAAKREEESRRERKQMEYTLDRIRAEVQAEAARAEQRTLDEAARLKRNATFPRTNYSTF